MSGRRSAIRTAGVTQAGSLLSLGDVELAMTIIRIFNDACKERMVESGGRINCLATLPYWDKDLTLSEARRCIDMGIKGFALPDRPERLVAGYLGEDHKVSPFWEPFFDLCNATGTPITFHINTALDTGSAIWDNEQFSQKLPVNALLTTIGTSATMANFMVSGILDKYENLKVALIESGIGWVPFMLEMMEHQFDEFRTRENQRPQAPAQGVFRQELLGVVLVRELRAAAHARGDRLRPRAVHHRLPAPDLALSGRAGKARGISGRPQL